MHQKEKIVIEIAAFCDPDLMTTIKSALCQADRPERVSFAICHQSDDLEELENLKKIKNCRVKHLGKADARGICYARYLCQKLIKDEEYVWQIDAHMKFCKHWDTKMIELLLSLKDKKAIISFYPPSLTEEMEKLPIDDAKFDAPSSNCPIVNHGKRFYKNGSSFLEYRCSTMQNTGTEKSIKSPFIAGGNLFTFAKLRREIIEDPEMFYLGDELPMAIRYYTHGWNNYCPNKCYIYHKYQRKDRVTPINNGNHIKKEAQKFELLLKSAQYDTGIDEYGLGKERSLKQFEEFAGINFTKRIIYMNCETGQFENKSLYKKISMNQDRIRKNESLDKTTDVVQIVIIDLFGQYEECINSCIKNTTGRKIEFVIGTTKKIDNPAKNEYVKHLIQFSEDSHYSEILSKLVNCLENYYTVIIDSSTRFIPGWDKEIISTIGECGQNSALTNWIWRAPPNTTSFAPYLNAEKEFDKFDDFLPVLKQNNSNTIKTKKYPYKTPFISNGFLFCHAKILKENKPDPNLSYKEHNYIYSARLWTSGIDLYYPKTSYFFRIKDEFMLDNKKTHKEIICGLMGISNSYGIKLEKDYKYPLGKVRPLWGWYDFIGYDCNNNPEFIL